MSFCNEKGIPHSVFLEWDPEDRAKALAFIIEAGSRCTMCGTAPWEWEENKFAYTPVEEFCKGCYQKSVFQDTETNKTLPGTNVRLVPTTKQFRARQMLNLRKRGKMMRNSQE